MKITVTMAPNPATEDGETVQQSYELSDKQYGALLKEVVGESADRKLQDVCDWLLWELQDVVDGVTRIQSH